MIFLTFRKVYTCKVVEKFVLNKNVNSTITLLLHVFIGLCFEQEVNVF